MRKKILLIILTSIIIANISMAQKKSFSLGEIMSCPGYTSLSPKTMWAIWWNNTLVTPKRDSITIVSPEKKKGKPEYLFTLKQINQILVKAGEQEIKSLWNSTFPYGEKPIVSIVYNNKRYVIDWKNDKLLWKGNKPEDISVEDWNCNSKNTAYVSKNNLYVQTADGKTHTISTDGSRDIVYGQSVHRNEFGITNGTFWNPQGTLLAFYRMDQSMVTDYPQVNIDNRIAQYTPDKYPMAGMTSHEVTIGVFNPQTDKTIWLELGEIKNHYFANIAWAPNGDMLYVNTINRAQNHLEMWTYSATTGKKLKQIYTEDNDKFIEAIYTLKFLPWDKDKFVYQTEKDGYCHLYLFTSDGKQLKDLTPGNFVVSDIVGFNAKTKSVIVATTEIHDLQHNIYSINTETGKRILLDNGKGMHNGKISAGGQYVYDNWSSPDVRLQYDLLSTTKRDIKTLYKPRNPFDEYNMPEITQGSIKAADGKHDLYYRMVKPVNFDPTKKYPVIIYVYGGPHSYMVKASYGYMYRSWDLYMAQQGYLMFIMDNRGTSERDTDFEKVIYKNLGVEEMKDQMKGVEFLKSLPYVDSNRIGIHGWSYGGFMTTNLMLTYPDVFKCGVAGGPVIDWKYYEVMYGERYMSTPQENKEGYDGSNLNLKAGNLKGRLDIITGYNDPVCVPQHTLSFFKACAKAGTHPDFYTYPGQEHNMTAEYRLHLYEHITRYFEDFLK